MATSSSQSAHDEHLLGDDALKRVRELLAHFRSAMFINIVDGRVSARPMGLLGKTDAFEGSLWFFADDRSGKVAEINKGAHTVLTFQNDGQSAFLQLNGTARVWPNRTKMQELFTPLIRTWFPDGLDDPHLTLIQFDAIDGSFWDSPGGMLQVLGAFTKAMLTGTPGSGGRKGDVSL